MESMQTRMSAMLDKNKRIVKELKMLQGITQKVVQQTSQTSSQVLDLKKRGMEQNLILHGVDNSIEIEDAKAETPMFHPRERPKYAALEFLRKVLKVNLEVQDIWKAHRSGPYREGKVKLLYIKVSYQAKDLIMENVGSLKGLSNPKTQQTYFVGEQIPEGVTEMRKQTANRVKVLKDANEAKPKENRQKIQVLNNKILVDGKIQDLDIVPPQPSNCFWIVSLKN